MAKELTELYWIEELLPADCASKRMFGGFAYYLDEKLLLVMFESTGNREYRGQSFPFEIWNGCMFPAEKEHHSAILNEFPFLLNHPVLPKWLYLPLESEEFEPKVEGVLKELRRKNPWFGSYPKARSGKSTKGKGSSAAKSSKSNVWNDDDKLERIDTRTPRMFSDEPATEALQKARTISDLKNLGIETEKAFAKAGIKTAQQLIKLGWKKAMAELCKVDKKHNHAILAYAVIGALQNRIWNGISEEDKAEAREYIKSLRDQAKQEETQTKKSKSQKAKKVTSKKVMSKKPKTNSAKAKPKAIKVKKVKRSKS